ncbi:glutamyl-tRNA reductase [Paenactinomyces guangxiensis]|uniref:Glutamyl-tRNA reductase n=1 Tax=Paenactinomyces guangxiensis TaxID=1490290 RepID=A0A7W2AAW8_9BACL|nr:glutamyl-tRNA reductase [Paenactinomyces guangxiensis]MBA4496293.1 glutamyl-tRNA reductase [Paenactinomyces guangxiensis]MBH8593346.1 glutamyl-tRNA reductase [Paenactinomyces guangxiensis]
MHILIVGFNHKTAPVELREKLSFSTDRLQMALRNLRDMKSILECVIVSTCNRMELYVVCDQLHTGEYYSKSFLESWFRIPKEEFTDYLYVKQNQEAVRHLFTVVCGLDSLVLGETQILGQVKSAFLTAQSAGTTGTIFNMLFRQAVTLGKRVHSETEIGQNAVSVSYAAVELGKQMFDTFADKTVMLIGAGKMSELTAKHFYSTGATRVLVLNRTFARAEEVAARFKGEARPWEELGKCLQEADIVVSSTGSSRPILTPELVEPVLRYRRSPLFLIDIAVPRDIDPAVHQLDQVFLYDIDDLHGIVDANMSLREQEAEKVRVWIGEETDEFGEWLNTLGVVPLISALRDKALGVQEETMARIERKLPDLTEQQKRVLRKQTKSIVNQLLRDPIVRIKELAASSGKEEALDMFVHLFALEGQIKAKEQEKEKQEVSVDMKQPAFVSGKAFIRS